jgi:hypothetical protein
VLNTLHSHLSLKSHVPVRLSSTLSVCVHDFVYIKYTSFSSLFEILVSASVLSPFPSVDDFVYI